MAAVPDADGWDGMLVKPFLGGPDFDPFWVDVFQFLDVLDLVPQVGSVSPDGRWLAVLSQDGGAIDVTTGLGYPKKANDAAANPKVALLFSEPTGSGPCSPAAYPRPRSSPRSPARRCPATSRPQAPDHQPDHRAG